MSEIPYESVLPQPEPIEQLVPPSSLTQVPRAMTPRARKRSWNELPVRLWVILSLAVALITIYFTISKYLSGRYERWLITQGVPIEAMVQVLSTTQDPRIEFKRTDRLQAQLGYTYQGKRYEFAETLGWLAQLPDQKPTPTIRVGDKLPIRIDPERPTVWTDRTQPRPWLAEFTIVVLLVPLLVALVLVTLLRRWQVLRIWSSGMLAPAAVVELKQTAVAPLSRVVRFTLVDGSDRRVFATLHPAEGAPRSGDVIWVIFSPGKPGRAIIANLYT